MKFHYHLLINQASGSGHGKKTGERIANLLKNKNFQYTAYYTEYAGHEHEIIKDLVETTLIPWTEETPETIGDGYFPLLIVIGGDGTLHQVMNQFYQLGAELPIAYIPAGSGNDFARGIGLPREPEQAFWRIAKAQAPQSINILTYEEKIQEEKGVFVNNVGIGLDAAIVHATNESGTKEKLNKYNLGSLSYIVSVLKVLFTQKGFPILVEINGKEYSFEKAFLCTTTNHPYFGGGVAIAPSADVTKSNLDLVIVERISLFKILGLIFKLLRKKHTTSKHFHQFTGNRLQIVSPVPQYGQADGEVLGHRSFDITFATKKQQIWY